MNDIVKTEQATDNSVRLDVHAMSHEQLIEHVKRQNYVIAALAGRIDVTLTYVDKQQAAGRPVDYEFQQYITRTAAQVDDMLDALSRGEPVN
jgi:hypothetical protein